jgi:hypothetical protein
MPWVRIVLSQADIEANREEEIRLLFMGIWATHAGIQEAGVFRKGNMLYFSPKAAEISGSILSKFRSAECPAPLRDDVEIVAAGDLNAIPFAPE